ncbi:MAG: hypothetical protein M3451_14350 [Chloroflexota bacterium]|nr:hypothetical protein [Chloroflexota bacterium]
MLADDVAGRRFDVRQPVSSWLRERGEAVEILIPLLAVLALVLVGVLAQFVGTDSRTSIRDDRNVWNDRKEWW